MLQLPLDDMEGNYKPWKPRCYICGQPGVSALKAGIIAVLDQTKAKTAKDKSDSNMSDSVETFTASVGYAT